MSHFNSGTRKILFLTGHLAEPQLRQVLAKISAAATSANSKNGGSESDPLSGGFNYHIHDIGVQVAGLMTTEIIARRLPPALIADFNPDEILVPGRCRGDLAILTAKFGKNFRHGPDDLH
ncbi:MAG: DUF6513 domain-containing protein, partial [Alphaproteobacteria bacterium]|nr:DUF6513 domain-containing protein [Alphaproteobacteria bacterium]